jgi:Protein of unknown function (DUF3450)
MVGRHSAGSQQYLRRCFVYVLLALPALLSQSMPAAAQNAGQLLDTAISEQAGINQKSQQSQLRIAQLDEQASEYFGDYRVAVQQLESSRIYNGNLERLINDQEREKQSINRQLDDFGDVEQGIVPLMYEMIAALKAFIDLDMPFSQNERRDRVRRLENNMDRSDLTVSEKYRQIMEAYQIETSYGRNIETYLGTLAIDGVDRKVDMLRVGRVLLAYQTPDQSETGFWDTTNNEWVPLEGSYRRAITEGIRVARKQAAPALLELPLPAAGARP